MDYKKGCLTSLKAFLSYVVRMGSTIEGFFYKWSHAQNLTFQKGPEKSVTISM